MPGIGEFHSPLTHKVIQKSFQRCDDLTVSFELKWAMSLDEANYCLAHVAANDARKCPAQVDSQ